MFEEANDIWLNQKQILKIVIAKMTKISFEDIEGEFNNNNFIKSILMSHDFVQLVLYDCIMAALGYLNMNSKIEVYLRKSLRTPDSKNSTFKTDEIKMAYKLGLITDVEKTQVMDIKKFRDSKAAHLSLYFDKQVLSGEEHRSKIEETIKISKDIILKLLKRRDEVVRETLKDLQ